MSGRPAPSYVSGSDPLPSAELVAQVKRSAFMACAARSLDLPWPPGLATHAMIDAAPLVALAVLEATCPTVAVERLARCLGLAAADGVSRLDAMRASDGWPGDVFKATLAAIEGLYPALARGEVR
jgi:hypothetical protein